MRADEEMIPASAAEQENAADEEIVPANEAEQSNAAVESEAEEEEAGAEDSDEEEALQDKIPEIQRIPNMELKSQMELY
ncbi:hypothetical protein OROMI_009417 [Orobanche minor]